MTPSKFAVTGGIGSGKSAVCRLLCERGYPVFSCDEINHTLLQDEEYLKGLAVLFPACFRKEKLDKAALASLVFSDRGALEKLNGYAHPRIYDRLKAEMERAKTACFAEVPLLFESGKKDIFDGAIVVLREKEARINAVIARDGLTREEAEARIKDQFDYDGPLPKGCYVVRNDGDEEALEHAVDGLLKTLQEQHLI